LNYSVVGQLFSDAAYVIAQSKEIVPSVIDGLLGLGRSPPFETKQGVF